MTEKPELKKGEIVFSFGFGFDGVFTCEGKCELQRFLSKEGDYERWEVKFFNLMGQKKVYKVERNLHVLACRMSSQDGLTFLKKEMKFLN